jgi:hypothetical protein
LKKLVLACDEIGLDPSINFLKGIRNNTIKLILNMNNESPKLKIEHTHPHAETCESFQMALKMGHLVVINSELQIPLRADQALNAKEMSAGNILTGEKYELSTLAINLAIFYCPFCGVQVAERQGEDDDF